MSYSYELVGSVVDRLNSNLQDPYNGTRTGSWVFGPDKEINYNRYMPKIQVLFDGEGTSDKSKGNNFKRTKQTTLLIGFFTKDGDIGSYSELKNRNLVLYMIEKIEQDLKSYQMDNFSLMGVGDVERLTYMPEHSIHLGAIPFFYKRREI